MNNVAVIDYGMGNLHSVAKAVESLSADVRVSVTSDAEQILNADRIIFPGVGAIRDCMAEIRRLGVDEIVTKAVAEKRPVLAICVGMQALMERSEENGNVDCLNMLPGQVLRFGGGKALLDANGQRLKVPHMGWNQVTQTQPHPLWHKVEDNTRFYFVHSYYVQAGEPNQVAGTSEYGEVFTAALSQDSLFAVQFHPEKSQHAGLQLLDNFLHWDGTR
ncbi:imidazole glycerol phosphate synthase subunit HisH [Pseudohongiella nitratireducens]|nr:imidazole glycerol phosphate synthase subunit HisH [Pseudohongiella nitratireducens]MDF1622906.1 imidazole glycerol phosphate synthase subunit HisH [Pseudohongiella nitratireducens]|tara:strand:+ start:1539 stop:2192 length:654 start_codon:yes stop_codon:yes gene_type:complete